VLIIQSLAAKLGIVTGRHLAELCMGEYPKYVRYGLWFFAELGVIAATIPGGNESCVARFRLPALV
jgi:NRAMP (natural resistance-associated macrophage protein)-like metal ion transporter